MNRFHPPRAWLVRNMSSKSMLVRCVVHSIHFQAQRWVAYQIRGSHCSSGRLLCTYVKDVPPGAQARYVCIVFAYAC